MADESYQIVFRVLSEGELEAIGPLWRELQRSHARVGSPFSNEIAAKTFESRLTEFRRLAAEEELRVEAAYAPGVELPVAYCVTSLSRQGDGEVESLFVSPAYRRRRIASRLVRQALDWLKASGAKRERVVVLHENREALEFYRRFAFFPRNVECQRLRLESDE